MAKKSSLNVEVAEVAKEISEAVNDANRKVAAGVQLELEGIFDQDFSVEDEASEEEEVAPQTYEISSYGADYDVEGLVKRLTRKDVVIPDFQRAYVWNQEEASRLVESLLLGLPVPGVFMAKERNTNKLLVIDGQQRLKSLQLFFEGIFKPSVEQVGKPFQLIAVQKRFLGKTYTTLEEEDRRRLNDSIVHATIVKQETPDDEDTSIYHIFERLNNGGRKLSTQEIRAAVYHGELMDIVKDLNSHPSWRSVFGKMNTRLKDQEMILRFLAFYYMKDKYKDPMSDFINRFSIKFRNKTKQEMSEGIEAFKGSMDLVHNAMGNRSFRLSRVVNAAVFDSVAVTVALNIKSLNILSTREKYEGLLSDEDYKKSVSKATANELNVVKRFEKATQYFSS
jgi:hypothetical protein